LGKSRQGKAETPSSSSTTSEEDTTAYKLLSSGIEPARLGARKRDRPIYRRSLQRGH
jgi:hypothetical protein